MTDGSSKPSISPKEKAWEMVDQEQETKKKTKAELAALEKQCPKRSEVLNA